jgi:diaminopimelate decarboxylase
MTNIQGIEYSDLADQFGTPLYVYDGDLLASTMTGLRERLHPDLEVFYSLKANPNISVVATLLRSGARAEVCSLVELQAALGAGAAPEDIIFLGPGKSEAELAACLRAGIYAVVCESFEELSLLDQLAAGLPEPPRVLLRINPAIAVSGSRLTMGGKPRPFGISEDQVLAARGLGRRYPRLRVAGIEVYMGTRILDPAVVGKNTRYILELADRVADSAGLELDAVDIGGGLGVAYFDGEDDLDLSQLADEVNPLLDKFAGAHPGTRLIMESGRYLTARAGVYLTRVRYVKESMGERFAIVDGGTHHHMAAVGLGSFVKRNFPSALVSRPDGVTSTEPDLPHNVSGPLCTPNDTLLKHVSLPPLVPGDLLAVLRSGAYGPSASPGLFLSHGYPAEVLVRDRQAHLVRRRDEPADLLRPQSLYQPAIPGNHESESR